MPDFRWTERRVILEADGRRFHDHLLARADDQARQAALEAAGETVLQHDVARDRHAPVRLVRRVRAALGDE